MGQGPGGTFVPQVIAPEKMVPSLFQPVKCGGPDLQLQSRVIVR